MPRLDVRWDNFWERGQVWYGFGSDGGPFVVGESITAAAIVRRAQVDFASLDAVLSAVFAGSTLRGLMADAFIVNPYRAQHDRGDGPNSRSPHFDRDIDTVVTLSKALGVYAEGQDLRSVLSSIVSRISALEG